MDPEHRQELRENDLMEFFRNFRLWWDKYGTMTLLAILVVVGGFVGWQRYSTRDLRAREAAWADLASAQASVEGVTSPERLTSVAAQHRSITGLSNFATLQAADQLLLEVTAGLAESPTPDVTTPDLDDELTEKLNRAAGLYQQVIVNPQPAEPSVHRLNARLGLAAVHETLGEFEKAREQYRLIKQEAGDHANFRALADRLLADLDQLREPIVFARAPEPAAGATDGSGPGSFDLGEIDAAPPAAPGLEGILGGPAGETEDDADQTDPAPSPDLTLPDAPAEQPGDDESAPSP